jgi:hypothetical protein
VKRIFLPLMLLLVVALTACAPNQVVNLIADRCPKGYTCDRTAKGWRVVADSSAPGFVLASSADIGTDFTSKPSATGGKSCQFRTVEAGARRNLECIAPNDVTVNTTGEIQVLILATTPTIRSDRAPLRSLVSRSP